MRVAAYVTTRARAEAHLRINDSGVISPTPGNSSAPNICNHKVRVNNIQVRRRSATARHCPGIILFERRRARMRQFALADEQALARDATVL